MKAIDYIYMYTIFPLLKIYRSSRYKPGKTEITTTTVLKVLFVPRENFFNKFGS